MSNAELADRGFSRTLPAVIAILASVLLLVSLKLPLWQMRLEAPQYRDQEALHIAVHPNSLRGDLGELSVLDRYIGVHIPPTLPQFKWLPVLLISSALLGFVASLLRFPVRRLALTFISCVLAGGLALAAVQAMLQIRDIGHRRDQKTVLAGVKDFTPPFLGTSKIAQFTVSSRFGLGAWFIGGALLLQLGAACVTAGVLPSRAQQLTKSGERPVTPESQPIEPCCARDGRTPVRTANQVIQS